MSLAIVLFKLARAVFCLCLSACCLASQCAVVRSFNVCTCSHAIPVLWRWLHIIIIHLWKQLGQRVGVLVYVLDWAGLYDYHIQTPAQLPSLLYLCRWLDAGKFLTGFSAVGSIAIPAILYHAQV